MVVQSYAARGCPWPSGGLLARFAAPSSVSGVPSRDPSAGSRLPSVTEGRNVVRC